MIDNLKEQLYAMTVDRDFNKQQLEAIRNTKAYRVYKKIRVLKGGGLIKGSLAKARLPFMVWC